MKNMKIDNVKTGNMGTATACDKKRIITLFIMISMIIFTSIIINSSNVSALGVAPSTEVIKYSTEEQTVNLRIINNEHKDMKIAIIMSGELANYTRAKKVLFDVTSADSEVSLDYQVKLPADLAPGPHNSEISIVELPKESGDESMILSSLIIMHELRVNVPYPGKFAEGILYISTANANDTVTFTSNVINRGSEAIKNIVAEIIIRGPTNEEIARIDGMNIEVLDAKASGKLVANWKADVNEGMYIAEFVVNYDDKMFIVRQEFNIGKYNVDITDMNVKNFKLGAIAQLDIDVVNRWNQPIPGIFADVYILNLEGTTIKNIQSNTIELKPLTTTPIKAYWDTEGLNVGSYDIKVVINYAGKASEKIFRTVVGIDSIDVQDSGMLGNVVSIKSGGNTTSILVGLVIVLVILNVGWLIYFKFLKKKE
jgi:hypothetical protein